MFLFIRTPGKVTKNKTKKSGKFPMLKNRLKNVGQLCGLLILELESIGRMDHGAGCSSRIQETQIQFPMPCQMFCHNLGQVPLCRSISLHHRGAVVCSAIIIIVPKTGMSWLIHICTTALNWIEAALLTYVS